MKAFMTLVVAGCLGLSFQAQVHAQTAALVQTVEQAAEQIAGNATARSILGIVPRRPTFYWSWHSIL